jgi:hypothetical protein
VEERLLAFRSLCGEEATGNTASLECGAGVGGGDAHGLTEAKLRCAFGLVDEAGAMQMAAREQAEAKAAAEAAAEQERELSREYIVLD